MKPKNNNTWKPDQYQCEVIDAKGGCHLVLAPPGCGKTQILTERIRQAALRGTDFSDMLCLTFTNRAARGMLERIAENIEDERVAEVYVGNIHRFCSKFLFDNNVVAVESSVIDESDAISIISRYLDEDEYLVEANPSTRREYASIIHLASMMHQIRKNHPKALRIHPECINQNDIYALRRICEIQQMDFTAGAMIHIFDHAGDYLELVKSDSCDYGSRQLISALLRKMEVAHYYFDYKKENLLLDFEDLLMLTYDVLRDDSDGKYKQYSWIQVDEVQDLNPIQLSIVDLLSAKDDFTVMYLGDEQQAIFSFMGAKVSTLDKLKERCSGRLHRLFVNHRSPKYLLEVFNTYAENQLHIDKGLLPDTDFDPRISGDERCLLASDTIDEEYSDVAEVVRRLYSSNDSETTAVIVNSNYDADKVSEQLKARGLSHFKVSGDDAFSSNEMKLLLAHLNILSNEHSFIGWSRLLKGLKVFESNAAARSFVRDLRDRAMLPSDFLCYEDSTYVQEFLHVFENEEMVVFDTETTGLNIHEDDIVQIAAVKMRCGKLVEGSEFSVFIATKRDIPRQLGDIDNPVIEEMRHHVLYEHSTALRKFIDYCGNDVLCGHNVAYDYHILRHNLQRYLPKIDLESLHPVYFDTLKLARLLHPGLKNYRLGHLLSAFNLQGANSHLADADVDAAVHVATYCHQKSRQIIGVQWEMMRKKSVREHINVLRDHYLGFYLQSKSKLYVNKVEENHPVLVEELLHFYHYLLANKFIRPIEDLRHIIKYLSDDVVDSVNNKSLNEQINAHIVEINTLKEADLCNSDSIDDRVFVTTIHKAKGLEFDNVIVFDAVEGRIPNYFNRNNPAGLAEDRRKFYVAITRARKRLYVAYSTVYRTCHNESRPRYLTSLMKPLAKFFKVL